MYEVIVGNIGTVYSGGSSIEANQIFLEYRKDSREGIGRAAGEDVTVMCDGEIKYEYIASLNEKE